MVRLSLLLTVLSSALRGEVTYSQEIARVLQDKCQQCHRPSDIAPFPLMSYEDAKANARAIRSAVSSRVMPPWKPVDGFNSFRENYNLTEDERQMIMNWVDAGAPEGDARDLPLPRPNTGEWHLGEPDLVLRTHEPFAIPAGKDTYRCFVIPVEADSTRWIEAVQIAPGSREHVHHVLLYLDTANASARYDGKDGRPGYDCFGGPGDGVAEEVGGILGGWAPGVRASRLPENVALALPAQTRIVMQVHYHSHGEHGASHEDFDQTKVGLYFAKTRPARQLVYLPVDNDRFAIPAGAASHTVIAQEGIPLNLEIISVAPHMHLLGRSIKVEKIGPPPDGQVEPLIFIDNWDFNWQAFYTFDKPMQVAARSAIRVTCTYDNSAQNPRNPNQPPKAVTFGEGTTDEMCLALVGLQIPPVTR